jgi:hypothetical protein
MRNKNDLYHRAEVTWTTMIISVAIFAGIGLFLFLVWATVTLLRFMGVMI